MATVSITVTTSGRELQDITIDNDSGSDMLSPAEDQRRRIKRQLSEAIDAVVRALELDKVE